MLLAQKLLLPVYCRGLEVYPEEGLGSLRPWVWTARDNPVLKQQHIAEKKFYCVLSTCGSTSYFLACLYFYLSYSDEFALLTCGSVTIHVK